ncbi:MAG TPA: BrxE family protein, partial [Anaerolineaceae bacterium]|nr:BrxE family protein [Anaerolineaceae bacterium]
SAGRAALAAHDERIGKGTVAHLFRLAPHLERAVDERLTASTAELEALYAPMLNRREALLEQLSILAGAEEAEPGMGPVQISVLEARLPAALGALYLQAFRAGTQVFPYFETESGQR